MVVRLILNDRARPDGSPASLGEVLKSVGLRIARQSARGRGVHLSATEVRALDWATLRDSSIRHSEERWLLSAARNRDLAEDGPE